MDIIETLDLLSSLQSVDSGIDSLEKELALLPRNLAAAEEDLRIVEAQVAAARHAVEEIQKRRRGLEREIEEIGQAIVKFETQKLSVKTNAEYQALNHQIAHQKEKRSGIEDQVIVSFDDEHSAAEKAKHLEAKHAEVKKVVEVRHRELEERSAEDRLRLAELRGRREGIAPRLEARLMNTYEMTRARKGGTAVVPVSRGSCAGCFSALPPQIINEVKKRNALLTCEFCGRFLVHEPEA